MALKIFRIELFSIWINTKFLFEIIYKKIYVETIFSNFLSLFSKCVEDIINVNYLIFCIFIYLFIRSFIWKICNINKIFYSKRENLKVIYRKKFFFLCLETCLKEKNKKYSVIKTVISFTEFEKEKKLIKIFASGFYCECIL